MYMYMYRRKTIRYRGAQLRLNIEYELRFLNNGFLLYGLSL